jgi:membrane protease subunit HflC
MQPKVLKYLIFSTVILFMVVNSLFIVDQRQKALVVQFGEVMRLVEEPGLKFKVPFMQEALSFDNRILDLGISEQEVIAADQKRLIVDAFAKYKIIDPLKFYTTVNNRMNAESKLSSILESSLRRIVGEISMVSLLTEDRNLVMSKIKEALSNEAEIFGIEIIDVRIVRGDLPKENSEAIFTRMQTEREKEARITRATGFEEAEKIKAEADKQKVIILADARKKAETTRGEGDSAASKIFASAFSRDPEFFNFYRSMQAYGQALQGDKTTMVISPDSEFFKYFGNAASR